MDLRRLRGRPAAVLVASALLLASAPARGGSVDPGLSAAIQGMKPGTFVPVVVWLSNPLDPASIASGGAGRHPAAARLVQALKAHASSAQGPVLAGLAGLGARSPVSLWAINAIAVSVVAQQVPRVAELAGVDVVRLDSTVQAPVSSVTTANAAAEWNVAALRAPELWASGTTGTGIVVASLDTGVDPQHPDLSSRRRGGAGSWYDPSGQHATPYDASGHGTQVMGLIVGGSSSGTGIGVAPGASWIAAKIFDDQGQSSLGRIHQAFQWLLDPDGNPATDDLPDVVNNSWGYPSTVGTCWGEFATDISLLRTAGVAVVFSAGNDGGSAGTSESPANNAGTTPTGAVDQANTVAPFSSRGPGACGGGLYPALVAPGVSVRTSDLTFGGIIPDSYVTVSGTSFAAPHVAGATALLWSAYPGASAATIEGALRSTAKDLGIPGPDNDTGYGLPDLVAAGAQLSGLPSPPTASPDSYAATGGTTFSAAAPGVLGNDSSPTGAPLTSVLVSAPASGTLSLAADGSFTYAAPAAGGTFTFSYRASDGTQASASTTVTLVVAPTAQPPVSAADTYATTAGALLAPAAPGVLANDTGGSGGALTAVLVSGPSRAKAGTFALNANGSFTYATDVLTASSDSFTYRASDGTLQGSVTTVSIAIAAHPAPVAAADSYTVARNSSAVALAVLLNDTASNSTLVPSSLKIVSKPTKGGTASVSTSGTISYKPARNFKGVESFTYNVKDSFGSTSNTATVTVTVP